MPSFLHAGVSRAGGGERPIFATSGHPCLHAGDSEREGTDNSPQSLLPRDTPVYTHSFRSDVTSNCNFTVSIRE
jgi:hypothetical protein